MAFSFGTPNTSKPTLNLGTSTNNTNTNPGTTSFFGGASNTNNIQNNNNSNNSNAQSTANNNNNNASTTPQIDLAHLRNTTKYDHLQPQIQDEISRLDTAILNQMRQCSEVADLLPAVVAAGKQVAPAIDFVSQKLDELEAGLENDAEAIVGLRDGELRRDEGEVKCVFRTVDRLKMPRQYQVGNTVELGVNGVGGLSGWWNQTQPLRGSRTMRSGGQSLQLVNEDLDDDNTTTSGVEGPKSLVELFGNRVESFTSLGEQQKNLLDEIELFVGSLEDKVVSKEREINDRLNYGGGGSGGDNGSGASQEERDRQMQLLRFVFGEVQRGMYEVADKIGKTRDGVVELGALR